MVRRSGEHLRSFDDDEEAGEGDPDDNLAASAVSGQAPPAGPQWLMGLAPLETHALAYDKPLCASLDAFTLHAATRAGAPALERAGIEREEFATLGMKGWRSFVHDMPSRVDMHLWREWARNASLRAKPRELNDWSHVAAAAAYATRNRQIRCSADSASV